MLHLMSPLTPDSSVVDAAYGYYYKDKPVLATATGRSVRIYTLVGDPSPLLFTGLDLPLAHEAVALGFLQPDIQEEKDILVVMDTTGDIYSFEHDERSQKTVIEKVFAADHWESGIKPSKALFSVHRESGTMGIVSLYFQITIFKTKFGLTPQHYSIGGLSIYHIQVLANDSVALLKSNRDDLLSKNTLTQTTYQIAKISQIMKEEPAENNSDTDLETTFMDTSEEESPLNESLSNPSEKERSPIIQDNYYHAHELWQMNIIGYYETVFINNVNIGGHVLVGPTKICTVPSDILGMGKRCLPETTPFRKDCGKITATAEIGNKRIVSTSSGEVFLVKFLKGYDSDVRIPIPRDNIRFELIGVFSIATVLVPLGDNLIYFGSKSGDSGLYQFTEKNQRPHLAQLQVIENIGPVRDATTLQHFDRLRVITASGRGKDSTLRVIENAIHPIPLRGSKISTNTITAMYPLKMSTDPDEIDRMILLVDDTSTTFYHLTRISLTKNDVHGFLTSKTLAAKDIHRQRAAIQVTENALNFVVKISDGSTKRAFTLNMNQSIVQAVIDDTDVYAIMENGRVQVWMAVRDDNGRYKFVHKPTPNAASQVNCIDLVDLRDKGKFVVCANPQEIRVLKSESLQEYSRILLDESFGIPTSIVATGEDLFVSTYECVSRNTEFNLLNKSASGFAVVSDHVGLTLQHFNRNGFLFAACEKTYKREGFLVEKNIGGYSFPAFLGRTVCRIETSILRGYPTVLHAGSDEVSVKHLSRNKRKIEIGEDIRRLAGQHLTQSLAIIVAHQFPGPTHQMDLIHTLPEGRCIDVARRRNRLQEMDLQWTPDSPKDVTTVLFFDSVFFVAFAKIRFGPHEYPYNIANGTFTKYPSTPVYAISVGLHYKDTDGKDIYEIGYIAIVEVVKRNNERYLVLKSKYEHPHQGKPTVLGFRNGTLVAGFGDRSFMIDINERNKLEATEFLPDQVIPQLYKRESNEDLPPGAISTSQLDLAEVEPREGFRKPDQPSARSLPIIEALSDGYIQGMSYHKSVKIFGVKLDNGQRQIEPELYHGDFFIGCSINCLRPTSAIHFFYSDQENITSSGSSLFFGCNTGFSGWIMHLNEGWSTVLRLAEKAYDSTSVKTDLQNCYDLRFANRKAKNPSARFVDGEKIAVLMSLDKQLVVEILDNVTPVSDTEKEVLASYNIYNGAQFHERLETWLAKLGFKTLCDNKQAVRLGIVNRIRRAAGQRLVDPRYI